MQTRKFDELISYFNRKVAGMDIDINYKMELLGMVTALGCTHEKELNNPTIEPQRKTDEWCTDCKEYDQEQHCCPRWNRVIRQTLKDAQPEPCEDAVSRQAVLDLIADYDLSMGQVVNCIHALPPVQPDIIHCGECKHRDPEDHKCDCGHDILWQLPRDDEWYCADAERRNDEGD